MSSSSASTTNPDSVMKLECPTCRQILNLRRKHIGVAGACVHCKTPVKAVDRGDEVVLVLTGSDSNPVVHSPPPVERENAKMEALAEEQSAMSEEIPASPALKQESVWGFPGNDASNSEKSLSPPALLREPKQDLPTGMFDAPVSDQTPPAWEEENAPSNAPVPDNPDASDESGPISATNFLNEAKIEPIEEEAADQNATESPFQGKTLDEDSLFGDFDKPMGSSQGSGLSQSSSSTFSPGATESAGFAETLFPGGNESGSAPISAPSVSSAPKGVPGSAQEPELKPMTKKQQEQFAKGAMAVAGGRKSGGLGFFGRAFRNLIILAILIGAGWAALTFLPEEKTSRFKAAAKEWMQPVAGYLDFLPIDFGNAGEGEVAGSDTSNKESSDSDSEKSGIKLPAFEGLNKFSDQYEEYQKTASDQIGADAPEGKLPPKIPGIPSALR